MRHSHTGPSPVTTAPTTQGRDDAPDLGFGRVVAQESRVRLLNRDGTFNVVRHGLSFFSSLSAYHWFVTMSWPRFIGLMGAALLAWNTLFAIAYLACGPNALVVPEGVNVGSPYLVAFFFSVQTFATIGYGQIAPSGVAANAVVVVESFATILFITLVTGIVFARFSRPTARVMFSEKAVIAPYRDGVAFMLRLVNMRRSQLFEVSATLMFVWWTVENGKRVRKFAPLSLERPDVKFLPLAWTLVHPIDENSPLFGMSAETLRASDPEFLILLSGVDETWEQTVHARTSYTAAELTWGAKFASIFDTRREDGLAIDVRKLSEVEGP